MRQSGKSYDPALQRKALTGLGLRVLVAGYLGYLAWKIFSGMLSGGPIPVWGVWLICLGFAAVAAVFCVYAWRAYRKALKAAEIRPEATDQ